MNQTLLKKPIQKKRKPFKPHPNLLKSDDQIDLKSNSLQDTYNIAIEELLNHINTDQNLQKFILKSLTLAKQNAQNHLDPKLYTALQWPETIQQYAQFLEDFSKWSPVQTDSAWIVQGQYDQSKEIYDRLCHFHFLIGQDLEQSSMEESEPSLNIIITHKYLYNFKWFSEWLVRYTKQWGSYLDTPQSFTEENLKTFLCPSSSDYNVRDSMVYDYQRQKQVPNSPSGWQTFNQFFARKLNTGLRPIIKPFDNTIINSPADCTYKEQFPISEDNTIQQIVVKRTHKYASIDELLDGSDYADSFKGGSFVHYFLGPNDYHRFHTPVAGKVLECRNVQGKVMLAVNINGNQFDAPDDAKDAYEFFQARGILIIDTAQSECKSIGKVAIIPVGMCQVSSVMMTAQAGTSVLKGDEFGYFQFGGSDIIMLFEKGAQAQLSNEEIHYKYGEKVGSASEIIKQNGEISPKSV